MQLQELRSTKIGGAAVKSKIQKRKRLKETLFIRTKYNKRIFGVIHFIKVQNHT